MQQYYSTKNKTHRDFSCQYVRIRIPSASATVNSNHHRANSKTQPNKHSSEARRSSRAARAGSWWRLPTAKQVTIKQSRGSETRRRAEQGALPSPASVTARARRGNAAAAAISSRTRTGAAPIALSGPGRTLGRPASSAAPPPRSSTDASAAAAAAIADTEAACVDLEREREGGRGVDSLRFAFPEHDSPLCALPPSVFVGF